MTVIEYGKQNTETIILLHGGGLSWWNYKEVAEKLSFGYHIILPILTNRISLSLYHTKIKKSNAYK